MQEFQLKVLYVNDPETAQHWVRVIGKKCTTFKTKEKDFTISYTDSDTGNKDITGLDIKTNRHEGQSNQELVLIVNSALIESLEKANKQKTQPKKNLQKNKPTQKKHMMPPPHSHQW
jgi:hypothetical protein